MESVGFLNMFCRYRPEGELLELLSDAVVCDARVDLEARRVDCCLQSSVYIPASLLAEAENQLSRLYGIHHFSIQPKFPPESLQQLDCSELSAVLIREYAPLISVLAGCRWEHEGETFTVHLQANGVDTLRAHLRCAEDYVFARFGLRPEIRIEAGSQAEAREDLFAATRKIREEALLNVPAPVFKDEKAKKNAAPEQKDAIFGRVFSLISTPISELDLDMFKVCVEGEVFAVNHKELKKRNAWVVSFDLTDYTGSVRINQFMEAEKAKPILDGVKCGMWLSVLGKMTFDRYDNEMVMQPNAIMKIEPRNNRKDTAEGGRRVELHLHTQMSSMDALTVTKQAVKQAAKWGHPAIAITDHGVVQSFPDAMHASKGTKVAGTDQDIKILYGCEAYYYNDMDGKTAVFGGGDIPLTGEFVAFDLETTGLSPREEEITEFGAAIFRDGEIVDEFKEFVNPGKPLKPKIVQLTGITDEMLKDAPPIGEILPRFLEFCGSRPLVAHNANFDVSFILAACKKCGIHYEPTYVDTLVLAQTLMPHLPKHKLNIVADALSLPEFNHHRALDDALTVGHMMTRFCSMLEEKGVTRLHEINPCITEIGSGSSEKKRANHMLLFAKNQIGLRNLYRLISYSHLRYFYRNPRIPKSELVKYREGLIVGSACEAGELFRAITERKPYDELRKIASFYDFLEIQPLCNNRFMIEKGMARDDEELRQFNRTVVRLGEDLKKPVVATGDVHFLNPQDEVYRRILLATKGMSDGDRENPLYFRTTSEMLEEFSYLGAQKAFEVVVTNTNMIADMCETLRPVPKNLFAPKIENSVEDLKSLVYGKFRRLYGDNPPESMKKRVDTEMHDIISCHYDVIYMSAQKLVNNSLENGYLVGSRGSVGSSIVAYLSDITEVNSFPPHYRCPKCKYTTLDVPSDCACGADLPDAKCPKCGADFEKDGFNIPFETFLGFGGDKVPDIDLNFSGEYQAKAHAYCVQMFGSDHVFRAGTIGTVADKTAFGYVKKYADERSLHLSKAEESRLTVGCTGVKRTTGQHPGGLVVIPQENEIWDFCPVQHPADDTAEDAWITTHFEYHSMEENLLKLDMLGHDDPTMIRMMEDLTGVDAKKIPLDDKPTMSIFTSSKVLGYENDPILGPTGAVAVPEFNTRFTRGVLLDTMPEKFDFLVRISGYTHGTDVWLGNARELIVSGTATVDQTIGCRDDIMIYLISMGMDEKRAFKFMEAVRKGAIHKGKPWPDGIVEDMLKLGVPEWYIDSCRKIQYLFPKAHAVAYVMMAFRIAWFKVHKPLAFYSAYFYRRSQKDNFDAALMTQGKDRVVEEIRRIEKNPDATAKDEGLLATLEVCYEFYLRGFSFAPMDLYESDPLKFNIKGDQLIPPFVSVAGLGATAAIDIAEGRKGKQFLSIEEFSLACPKVSKTHIENLKAAGAFGDLPDTSQITLF